MTLSEMFDDPLDPSRSIQLNNRYWPGEKFMLLGVIADAEAMLREDRTAAVARHLQRLKKYFGGDRMFCRLLNRLHRLQLFRSQFGCQVGRLDLPEQTVRANQYSGSGSRASYPLAQAGGLEELARRTVDVYRAEYGLDFVKTNRTVRFAKPDERQSDITGYGQLSDYHNDEYKGISTVIYLSEVKDENGAFCFVRGSHLVPRSIVLSAIHQCVDFDMRLTTPDALAGLPLEFRGSIGIGNFLDEEKVAAVSQFIQIMEGGVGTYATFNGQYLLHRGGKPVAGSRTAAFLQPEGVLRHKIASVGSLLYGLAHR